MLEINQKRLTVPLIQGGMGVGVSLGSLAGHVAKCGAMGVISTAHPGYKEDDFESNTIKSTAFLYCSLNSSPKVCIKYKPAFFNSFGQNK